MANVVNSPVRIDLTKQTIVMRHVHPNKDSLNRIGGTDEPTWDGNPWPTVMGEGDVTQAGDNTFTGSNIFEGQFVVYSDNEVSIESGVALVFRIAGEDYLLVPIPPSTGKGSLKFEDGVIFWELDEPIEPVQGYALFDKDENQLLDSAGNALYAKG